MWIDSASAFPLVPSPETPSPSPTAATVGCDTDVFCHQGHNAERPSKNLAFFANFTRLSRLLK